MKHVFFSLSFLKSIFRQIESLLLNCPIQGDLVLFQNFMKGLTQTHVCGNKLNIMCIWNRYLSVTRLIFLQASEFSGE